MIRIAAIADSHFNDARRPEDCIAAHEAFLHAAAEEHVDLILHAGDIYDRPRSTPADRLAVSEWLRDASDVAPVVLVRGNHDAPGDIDLLDRIAEGRHSIDAVVMPDTAVIERGGTKIAVVCIPWFSKAQIASTLPADVADAAQTNELTIATARGMLDSLRLQAQDYARRGYVTVLLGHVQVAGSETSTGQTLIGQTVELAPADLAAVGCSIAVVGHIHKHQAWLDGRVVYPGSPLPQDFGERETKGWCLIEIDPKRPHEPRVTFKPLPVRELVLIDLDFTDPDLLTKIEVPAGALVRVRCKVTPEQLATLDGEAFERAYLAAGAAEVKFEPQLEQTTRARVPEIVETQDLATKFRAFLRAKGIERTEAEVAELLGLVDAVVFALEGGADAAA